MFFVIYRQDFSGNFVILSGPHESVADAFDYRKVAGDIVVDSNYIPVQGDEWLFDYEKKLPNPQTLFWNWLDKTQCYAKHVQALAASGNYKVGFAL